MKITRRGLAGVVAGAAAATQMSETKANYNYKNAPVHFDNDTNLKVENTIKPDPQYFSNQIIKLKKILNGDFSDCKYEFDNYTHARIHTNIECLKSISASGRQTFLENAFIKNRKNKIMEDAKQELDRIMGLPFSVTGILFK